jgi:hypothetical protein
VTIGRRVGGWTGRFPLLLLAGLAGCQASTTRPTFAPAPAALSAQLRLDPPEAFDTLLAAFRAEQIPLARVEPRDGWFDSGWLQSPDLVRATGAVVGPDIIRIRGWVDPGKPYHARYTVETVYRVMLDPSREGRELELTVPDTHPASLRVRTLLSAVLKAHGDPEDQKADSVATAWARAKMRVPQAAPDTTAVPRDTAGRAPRAP